MGFRDLLKRLFGPSKKALAAAEEARLEIERACTQTADLTDLRKTLRKEKTRMRRVANDAISGVRGKTEEETKNMQAKQKPLTRDEAEKKLESFGWKERK